MDSTMEGMLDTYLLETESLLDKLDEMLIADEKVGDFSTDDVNEIFRIMHTIKGSSAMMEFTPLSNIAHHIEDMFFFIRDKGIDSLNGDQKSELFDLMFRSEDFLRGGIEKVKAGERKGRRCSCRRRKGKRRVRYAERRHGSSERSQRKEIHSCLPGRRNRNGESACFYDCQCSKGV